LNFTQFCANSINIRKKGGKKVGDAKSPAEKMKEALIEDDPTSFR